MTRDQQRTAVAEYLAQSPDSSSADVAILLGITPRDACGLLREMESSGLVASRKVKRVKRWMMRVGGPIDRFLARRVVA